MPEDASTEPDSHFNLRDQVSATWLDRVERCVDLLEAIPGWPAAVGVVSDVGCGDRKLEAALARRGRSPAYRGYDVAPQSPATEALDLDLEIPPVSADVVTLLGIGEYLADLSA